MQLFVIRHAIAEEAAPGQDDASRELTDEGIGKLREVVRGLRSLELAFERILTSPWQRAAHTAKLLAPLCDEPPVVTELLCEPPRSELLELIAHAPEVTAIVGHEPWLGELIGWLVFGEVRHGKSLQLKKAGVVWLDGSAVPGGMQLRAFVPPRVMRAIR